MPLEVFTTQCCEMLMPLLYFDPQDSVSLFPAFRFPAFLTFLFIFHPQGSASLFLFEVLNSWPFLIPLIPDFFS